jgi:pyrroloquinoline quinone biosynthesis protein D
MADERSDGGALPGPAVNPSPIEAASRPAISRGFRLQWEAAQNAHVLLYPEGMIKLNGSAGEIMKRCNGDSTIADITADLEGAFASTGLTEDVIRFVRMAVEKKWLQISP